MSEPTQHVVDQASRELGSWSVPEMKKDQQFQQPEEPVMKSKLGKKAEQQVISEEQEEFEDARFREAKPVGSVLNEDQEHLDQKAWMVHLSMSPKPTENLCIASPRTKSRRMMRKEANAAKLTGQKGSPTSEAKGEQELFDRPQQKSGHGTDLGGHFDDDGKLRGERGGEERIGGKDKAVIGGQPVTMEQLLAPEPRSPSKLDLAKHAGDLFPAQKDHHQPPPQAAKHGGHHKPVLRDKPFQHYQPIGFSSKFHPGANPNHS